MIYVDSSIVLSQLLDEQRCPPATFWDRNLTASRLTYYEVWTRLNAYERGLTHGPEAEALMQRIVFVDLLPSVLDRVRRPFPISLRTLDALHLATIVFLTDAKTIVELASYDNRLVAAARSLGIPTSDAASPVA